MFYRQLSPNAFSIVLNLTFSIAHPELHVSYGAPSYLLVTYSINTTQSMFDIRVEWFDKTATRIPEALWLIFTPPTKETFKVNKLGAEIDSAYTMPMGERHLHATLAGSYINNYMRVTSLDAPLLALGRSPTIFPTPLAGQTGSEVTSGLSICMFNTAWYRLAQHQMQTVCVMK